MFLIKEYVFRKTIFFLLYRYDEVISEQNSRKTEPCFSAKNNVKTKILDSIFFRYFMNHDFFKRPKSTLRFKKKNQARNFSVIARIF